MDGLFSSLSSSVGLRCKYCSHENTLSSLICGECGNQLFDISPVVFDLRYQTLDSDSVIVEGVASVLLDVSQSDNVGLSTLSVHLLLSLLCR